MENRDKRKFYYRLLVAFAIIIPVIIGFTYAYFLAQITYTNNNPTTIQGTIVTGMNLDIVTDGDDPQDLTNGYINATNVFPITSGTEDTYGEIGTFKVVSGNNPYSINYSISITDITISNELVSSDFKWKLVCTSCNNTNNDANGTFEGVSNGSLNLKNSAVIASNTTQYYKIILWIADTSSNQIALLNKSFSGKVSITGEFIYS